MQSPGSTCRTCHGTGSVKAKDEKTKQIKSLPCPACKGSTKGYGTK